MKLKIHPELLRYVLKSIFSAIVLFFATHPLYSMTVEERREYLDNLLKTLPDTPAFAQWLKTSGELPPDFDALPRMNYLPDPLRFLDGRPVRESRRLAGPPRGNPQTFPAICPGHVSAASKTRSRRPARRNARPRLSRPPRSPGIRPGKQGNNARGTVHPRRPRPLPGFHGRHLDPALGPAGAAKKILAARFTPAPTARTTPTHWPHFIRITTSPCSPAAPGPAPWSSIISKP